MRLTLHMAVVLIAGAGAVLILDRVSWNAIRSDMIVTLAVMAGAALFRLGRGLPALEIDYLLTDETKAITKGLEEASERLAYMVAAIIVTIIALTFIEFMFDAVDEVVPPNLAGIVCNALSATMAGMIAFVVIRGIALVKGDLSLIRLQAKITRETVQRRHAEKAEKALDEASEASPFKSPTGYGAVIRE